MILQTSNMRTTRDGHLISMKQMVMLIVCLFCEVSAIGQKHFTQFCPANEVMPYSYPWITVTGRRSKTECASECFKEPRCELFTTIKLGRRSYECELYDFVHHNCQPTTMETTTYRIQGRGVDEDHCPAQSVFFPSFPTSCYLPVATEFNTITEAKAACVQHGETVHLVAIETEQEHEFLKSILVQHNAECHEWWTAGETLNPDTTVKASWFWNLNTRTAPMLYTSWLGSEPNNYGGIGEKYLNMWSPTARYWPTDFQWSDVPAWFYGCALCEFEIEI